MPRVRSFALVLSAGACLVFSACGSSDSTSSSTSKASSGSEKNLAYFQSTLDKLYKGTNTEPQGQPAKAVGNKKIAVIPFGMSVSAGPKLVNGLKEAAAALGWQVTVHDGKFDSNEEQTGIRNAIAAGADGIVLYVIDCPPVKSALQEAKKAGIPVVGIEGFDCNYKKPDQPQLFAARGGTYNGAPYAAPGPYDVWVKNDTKGQVDWAVDKTKGKANFLVLKETDSQATLLNDDGYREEIAKCSTCKISGTVSFVGGDFGPQLQQKVSQALLKYPDANVVLGLYDGVIPAGVAAAVAGSGRANNIILTGGEGDKPNIALARQGKQDMGVGFDIGWEGWAAADNLVRIFDRMHNVNSRNGIGYQVWDKDHNLPAPGQYWKSDIDYRSAYRKMWGLG